jgi:hypothetical protein
VEVQCYVAEISNGKAGCLPVKDSTLVRQLGDHIQSVGFVPEFVIDATDVLPIPEACEPLLSCCAAIAGDEYVWQRESCYDQVDHIDQVNAATAEHCSNTLALHHMNLSPSSDFSCASTVGEDAGVSAGENAGAEAPSRQHALCCYRTCGFHHVN